MEGDVGVHLDPVREDALDSAEDLLTIRERQDEVGRDGGEVPDVVVGAHRHVSFDQGLLDVGEPLGTLQLGTRPLQIEPSGSVAVTVIPR
ncbi:hypothetical protein ACGF8D_27510 [Streptomyces massasporeus]|uniref:hypothetical protein n=1 Tax=Streptomyces massasporeus TaxID=67324 RepID=UPI00371AA8A8